MSDYTELKRLAEAANNMDQHYLSRARAFTDFGNATNPSAIIALVEDYDQLKAEVEALRKDKSEPCDGCFMAEAEALRKDAGRYRWLRNKAMMGTSHDPAVLKDGPSDCCEFMFGEELDAAVDAAMSKESGQ